MLLKLLRSMLAQRGNSPGFARGTVSPGVSERVPLSLGFASNGRCKVCGGSAYLFDVVDLNKHCAKNEHYEFGLAGIPVYYSRCVDCGFVFTRYFDEWDTRRFSEVIYNDDYKKVD